MSTERYLLLRIMLLWILQVALFFVAIAMLKPIHHTLKQTQRELDDDSRPAIFD